MRELRNRVRFRAHLLGVRARLRAEGGFALIEVVASAALLLVVASGVLAGIEGPSRVSGTDETRTQATSLAQQDQERLRGMSFSSLVGYTATTPVTVGNVTYSRYSSAIWIHDKNDPDSCNTQADTSNGDYLKITSKVTPPNGQPVQLDSLMAAPAGGNANMGILAVQLTDQANNPVVGQNVSISGPDNMTVQTNSIGCAMFGLVDKGNYNVTFSRSGWLDPAGVNAVSIPTSVTANTTQIVTHQYAQSGRININTDTKIGAAAPVASASKAAMIANSSLPSGTFTLNAPAFPTQGSTSYAVDVFPAPSGYGVWAGGCAANNPTNFAQAALVATPTAGGAVTVTARQPAINLTVTRGGSNYANAHVRIINTDANCGTAFTSSTTASGTMAPAGFAGPGFPYGNYTVCADDTVRFAKTTVANTNPAGVSLTLNIASSGNATKGVCS